MLIDGKEYLEEAASHLRKLTEEEKVQMQCEMREKYRRDVSCIRKEGIEEGIRKGRTQMQNEMREKHEKDMDRIFALLQKLNADNRTDDITKVATNAEYRERLMKEYDL